MRYRSTYSYSESYLHPGARRIARALRREQHLRHEREAYARRIAIRAAFAADQRAEDGGRDITERLRAAGM